MTDDINLKAREILGSLNSVDRVIGLLTDNMALADDLVKQAKNFSTQLEASHKETLVWADKANSFGKRASASEATVHKLQQQNFWLQEQYDNLIEKILKQRGEI